MDMLPRQLEDGNDAYLPVPGGAVFNTALALGRLEEPVAYFGGVSTDMFGQQLIEHLQVSSVNTSYVIKLDKPSTLAFVKLTNGHAEYSFMDENSAGRSLDITMLPEFPDSVLALHFGAISLIPEPCGSAFEELMQRNHADRIISLDPNIRPSFISDESSYRGRLNRMIGMSDIIKVSDEDLEWLQPGSRFEEAAVNWLDSGVSIVILTMGKSGSRAITRTLDIKVPAEVVEVVDTVGAGDTFNAGMLSSLRSSGILSKQKLSKINAYQLSTALQFATKVAGFVVGKAGASPPWLNEING